MAGRVGWYMRGLLVLAVLALAASLGTLDGASVAQASCAGSPGAGAPSLGAEISAAPIAFVGTVIATFGNDRVARVRVESIWKGPVIPTLVTVSGTPDAGSTATSVDRTFQVGQRYLFLPFTATSPFQDNSCSPTRPYSSQLEALKPASAQSPAPGSDGLDPTVPSSPWWLWPGIAGLLVAGAAGAWIVIRRRGRPGGRASSQHR